MPLVVDEHPVGALGSCTAYPSFGETVRAWGLRRSLHYLQALAGEGFVEGAGEFGVAAADQEAEGADPVAEVHEQVVAKGCDQSPHSQVPTGRITRQPARGEYRDNYVPIWVLEEDSDWAAAYVFTSIREPGMSPLPEERMVRRATAEPALGCSKKEGSGGNWRVSCGT